jgi:hypothetical protein
MEASGVHSVLDLDTVGIKSIAALEKLRQPGGMDAIGRRGSGDALPLADGLWCCSSTFGALDRASGTSTKRIWVLTNDDDPCRGSPAERARLLQRVSDSRQTGEEIALWGLQRSGATLFDPTKLWDAVVTQSTGEADDTPQTSQSDSTAAAAAASNEPGAIPAPDVATQSSTLSPGAGSTMDDASAAGMVASLAADADEYDDDDGAVVRKPSILVYDDDCGLDFAELESRKRAQSKRTFARLQLRFPGSVAVGVCLYLTTVAAKVPAPRKVDGRTNKALKPFVSRVCAETGAVLRPHDIQLSLPVGASGVGVPVSVDDIAGIKSVPAALEPAASASSSSASSSAAAVADVSMAADPCIQVLSAVAASSLRPWMFTKASLLAFPSESQIAGSVAAFAAVHGELVRSKRMLLGRMVARAGSIPRFVALVPQQPRPRAVLSSAGFLVLELPYADDLRTPQLSFGSPLAGPKAVELAKAVVSAITLNPFSPDQFDSPALGKFFATAKCLALSEEQVDWDAEEDDLVQPDPAMSTKEQYAGPLRLLQAECDVDLRPAAEASSPSASQRPSKRPASSADPEAKRVKEEAAAAAAASTDWRKLVQEGRLAKLTLPVLRAILAGLGLPTAGRKADLVSRLEDHS